jgi:hypothetical protein
MRSTLAPLLVLAAACGDNVSVAPDGAAPDGGPLPDGAPPIVDPTQGAWIDQFSLPGVSGFGARVEDVALAADGTVYVAGIFADASGVAVANVARWTGDEWEPLGAGLDGWVRALAVAPSGVLWATVTSDDTSSAWLAVWDGSGWDETPALDGAIRGFALSGDEVVAVGDFTGGVQAFDIALGTWHALTPGGISGAPSAIAATPTGVCVAGSFDSIDGVAAENAACWNGTAWSALGAGLPGGVDVLARSPANGRWYAGGTLTFITDPSTGEYEAGIGELVAGNWRPFRGGIDNGFINEVRAIGFDGDDVIVGGHFQSAGPSDVPASHLARFTPGAAGGWSEVGGGLANDVGVFLPSIIGTNDLDIAADGTIWVAGLYTRAGGVPAVSIAAIPPAGPPVALVGSRTVLGVGGFVDTVAAAPGGGILAGGGIAFGGTTPMTNIGTLRGAAWSELGGGVPGIVRDVLVLPDGTIAVAGELFIDGALAAYAEWDGTAWQLAGGRVDGGGFALVRGDDGTLWLGGDLFSVDGDPLANLARRSPTGGWVPDGAFDGRVSGLAISGDSVVAVGSFTRVGDAVARAVAARSAAGAWAELGGGVGGDFSYVNAVAVSPVLGVIIGGVFDGAGDTASAVDLAAWDGATWNDLGTGFSADNFALVSALLPYGRGVFVAGGFQTIGGEAVSNLAWFDGTAWHALGAGVADLSEEMTILDDVLWIGGPFTAAGGRPASGLAAWDFAP